MKFSTIFAIAFFLQLSVLTSISPVYGQSSAQVAASGSAPGEAKAVAELARQQKLISSLYGFESDRKQLLFLESMAILAAYGGWNSKTQNNSTDAKYLTDMIGAYLGQHSGQLRRMIKRDGAVSSADAASISEAIVLYDEMMQVGREIADLVNNDQIKAANLAFRDRTVPLSEQILRLNYTLISAMERRFAKMVASAK